ncbi:LuxR C-terminal-related transcriptional regulator [Candidatus Berkiella aquae]|uniref:Response regulator transcription factor n=1 Tax=Candidatus Berkiella aquae TaxID=295108 RepID=A0A0Q9YRL1_9GAMM|nr:response regulator transcription factor [Candidatus Berkiella aquae]MCS5712098.1 response regulator transcription factor [Candidatus Berkiella aquae]
MILIASSDAAIATLWHKELESQFSVYEVDIHERRALDLCLKKVPFEVLVVDLQLLGESGVNEIASLRDIQPQLHIVIMAKVPDEREEISAIIFGAKAYCHFDIQLSLLPKVINTVMANELWVDRKFVTRLLLEIEDITQAKHQEAKHLDKGIATMTPRECEIAGLVATGASNRKIAEQLSISERTVKAHLGVIFRKIGITDRLQLALYMNRHQQITSIWHGSKPPHQDKH